MMVRVMYNSFNTSSGLQSMIPFLPGMLGITSFFYRNEGAWQEEGKHHQTWQAHQEHQESG